jgi:predicted MFS family arabinose efflux permease
VRGAGFGVVTVVGGILGATLVPRDRHGESVGLTGAAASLASLVFLPAGVALTHAGHFDVVGWLSFAPVLGIYPAVLLHRAPRRALDFGGSRRQARQSLRAIASVTVCLFVVTMALGAVSSYLPVETPAAPIAAIGLFGMGAAAVLARSLVGRLVDRIGTAKVLPVATAIAASGIWMVAASLSSRSTAAEVVVVAGCVVLGAGCGAVQTSTMVAAFAKVPQASISTASAAWNFSYDIGTALGVSAMSLAVAVQLGIPGGFSVVGLAVLLTVPAGLRSGRRCSR